LIVNEENKGWMKNFVEGLNYVTGDVIFFSDQDDIWYSEKIEAMSKIMQFDDKILCLLGGENLIDRQGKTFGEQRAIVSNKTVGKEQRTGNPQKFNIPTFAGCEECISKKMSDIICEMYVTNFPHDLQVSRLATLVGRMYTFEDAVIKRRMHGNNTSGVILGLKEGASNLEKRKQAVLANIQLLKSFMECLPKHNLLTDEEEEILRNTIRMQEDRYSFLQDKKLGQYLCLLKYMKHYSGLSMYLGDFVYAHNLNAKIAPIMAKIKRY
jgi:Glycosyl transferase family 2.